MEISVEDICQLSTFQLPVSCSTSSAQQKLLFTCYRPSLLLLPSMMPSLPDARSSRSFRHQGKTLGEGTPLNTSRSNSQGNAWRHFSRHFPQLRFPGQGGRASRLAGHGQRHRLNGPSSSSLPHKPLSVKSVDVTTVQTVFLSKMSNAVNVTNSCFAD